jgi:uncharacterized protein
MRLNVLTELRQPIGTVTVSEFAEERFVVDGIKIRDLTGTARLTRTNRGLLVRVRATAISEESCARCLKELNCPLEVAFDEEWVPIVDANTGGRVREDTAPDAFRISERFVLDLGEGTRQYLMMAEPAKPLCRPDCAGLCAGCGTDLSTGQCTCQETDDDRWYALSGIKLDRPGGE